jgi:hypothetical protein
LHNAGGAAGVPEEKLTSTWMAEVSDGVSVQVVVPLLHPMEKLPSVDPWAGAAVKVSGLPTSNIALHVLPQFMPAGEEVTVPLPSPLKTIVTAA